MKIYISKIKMSQTFSEIIKYAFGHKVKIGSEHIEYLININPNMIVDQFTLLEQVLKILSLKTKYYLDKEETLKIIKLLLEHRVDPNVSSGYDISILGMMSFYGDLWMENINERIEIIELLLQYGANPYIKDNNKTIFEAIVIEGESHVEDRIKIFLKYCHYPPEMRRLAEYNSIIKEKYNKMIFCTEEFHSELISIIPQIKFDFNNLGFFISKIHFELKGKSIDQLYQSHPKIVDYLSANLDNFEKKIEEYMNS